MHGIVVQQVQNLGNFSLNIQLKLRYAAYRGGSILLSELLKPIMAQIQQSAGNIP